ncbi:MAG: CsbD-like, partial [Frankiaceae bacterium]|nr:CsbD-like [Frankiaceae bacterium]
MGATDEAKGKLKEATGSLTGSDGLRQEGQAQQEKSEHESEAAKKRAEA